MANNLPSINGSLVSGHWDAYYVALGDNSAYTPPTSGDIISDNLIGQSMDGFNWKRIPHIQPVIVDEAGEVPVNGIQQGVEHFVTFSFVEYSKIQAALEVAVGVSTGDVDDDDGNRVLTDQVGQELLDNNINGDLGTLILVPKAGTSAETNMGVGYALVFPIAVVDTDVDALLASKLHQGPCAFHIYPEPSTGKCWSVVNVS